MKTRYDELIEHLRAAARPARPAPPQMQSYLEKVRLHAYQVTDRDVDELKAFPQPMSSLNERPRRGRVVRARS